MVKLSQATPEQITRRLVEEPHPERIYVFGFRACGNPGPDSDLDLVVIFPDGDIDCRVLMARARDAVGNVGCGVDVPVYPATPFDRRPGGRANFEYTIRNKGRLLYGADGMAFAGESLAKAWNGRRSVQRRLRFDRPPVDTVAFHCQQTIETTLTAFLVYYSVAFETMHNLGLLCGVCQQIDAEFAALRPQVESVSRFAVQARDPVEPAPTLEEVEAGLRLADDVWDVVISRLPAELRNVETT